MSLIIVVGEKLRERADFAPIVFAVTAKLNLNLEMISYGATRNNLSFVVAQERVRDVVTALHERPSGG